MPTAGRILVDGVDRAETLPAGPHRVAYMPQRVTMPTTFG